MEILTLKRFQDAGNVFAENIEFQVHGISNCNGMQVGVLESIRNYSNRKRIGFGIYYG